jgi:CBS domain-containing protein
MYFIPAGLLVKHSPQVLDAAQIMLGKVPDLSRLTIYGFLKYNLLPVTIGNIIGGGFFVGAIYWFVYLRHIAAEPVRSLMTKGPAAVKPDASVSDAAEIMKQDGSASVLVGELGSSIGFVSETDIIQKVVAVGKNPALTKVSQIMSAPLISVDIKTPLYKIYRTMVDCKIRHLIITEKGQQVGFVSVKDLLKKSLT